LKKLYQNVKVLDSGDMPHLLNVVLAMCCCLGKMKLLATQGPGKDKYRIVYPSISILAEPSVAIVDKTVDKDGNRNLAKAI
jgi:sulfate transport system substrate-binding protein